MQEIKIDIRVPSPLGTGWPHRTEMMYDTGSTTLLIFFDELLTLGVNNLNLSPNAIQTAGGLMQCLELGVELRILNETLDRVLVDWHFELATVMMRSGTNALRLSSKSLNGRFFIYERPTDRQLCIATSETMLSKML